MPQFRADIGVTSKAVTTAQGTLIGTQTTMPQASVYNVGCTVKYVGSAGTYTPGRYYTCVQDGAGYAWQEAAVIATGLDLSTGSRAVATDSSGMAVATDVTALELGYLSGVTSALQGQLNGKVPTSRTINGKALTDNITLSAGDIGAAPASAVLEASRALQSSSNGEVTVSNVTAVELSYLSGVTDAIQEQIDAKVDPADLPTKLSQLTNDVGFINNSVADLVNYYTKADTYTKTEVSNLISAIPKFSIQAVDQLPTQDISTTTIYLVPKTGSGTDVHDEYIYVDNTWEIIGSTAVDLSDYYTKAQVNSMVTPVQGAAGITINGVALQDATDARAGLMTVAQVGQLASAVSNAQSALNGNVTGGTFSNDAAGNLTLTLNRGAGALNVGPTALTAAKAIADGSGNNIASTYATQSALSSGLAGKADAGTEITGGAFSGNILTLNKQGGGSVDIPFEYTIPDGFELFLNINNEYVTLSNPTSGGTANGVGYRRISSVGSFLNVENQYVYIRYELGSNNTTSWLSRCLWITSTSTLKNYTYSDNSSELISSFNSTNISKLNDGSYKVSLNIGAESYAGESGAYPSNQPTAIYTCNVESNIVTSVAFSSASSLEFYVYSGARIRGVITEIRAS